MYHAAAARARHTNNSKPAREARRLSAWLGVCLVQILAQCVTPDLISSLSGADTLHKSWPGLARLQNAGSVAPSHTHHTFTWTLTAVAGRGWAGGRAGLESGVERERARRQARRQSG